MSTAVAIELPYITQTVEHTQATFVDGRHEYIVPLECEVCQGTGEGIVCKCQHFFYCSKEHQAEFWKRHLQVCKKIQRDATVLRQRQAEALHDLRAKYENKITDPPLSATRLIELSYFPEWNSCELAEARDKCFRAVGHFMCTLQGCTSRFCLLSALMSVRNHAKLWKDQKDRALVTELQLLLRLDEFVRVHQYLAFSEHPDQDVAITVHHVISRFQPEHRLPVQVMILILKLKTYPEHISDDSQVVSSLVISDGVTSRSLDDSIRGRRNEIFHLALQILRNNRYYWWLLETSKTTSDKLEACEKARDEAPKPVSAKEKHLATTALHQTRTLWVSQPELYRLLRSLLELTRQDLPFMRAIQEIS